MRKTYLPLTQYLEKDPEYGEIWGMIRDEFELTRSLLAIVTGTKDLMSDLPVEQRSVSIRERIVLPLVTIQQYALSKLRDLSETDQQRTTLEKLIVRCSFGIINAGRNSA